MRANARFDALSELKRVSTPEIGVRNCRSAYIGTFSIFEHAHNNFNVFSPCSTLRATILTFSLSATLRTAILTCFHHLQHCAQQF